MSWLLHKLQKLFGKSGGPKTTSNQAASASSGDATDGPNADDSVAVASRWQGEKIRVAPSVPPSPQDDPDNIDLSVVEPDTHRRLDVAPAATPGTPPEPLSFPTQVSELVSSNASLREADDDSDSAEPILEPPTDSQLPEIHDLLPAVEPEPSEDESGLSAPDTNAVEESNAEPISVDPRPAVDDFPVARRGSMPAVPLANEPSQTAQRPVEDTGSSPDKNQESVIEKADEPMVTSDTEPVEATADEPAILFSFDITESEHPESEPTTSLSASDDAEPENTSVVLEAPEESPLKDFDIDVQEEALAEDVSEPGIAPLHGNSLEAKQVSPWPAPASRALDEAIAPDSSAASSVSPEKVEVPSPMLVNSGSSVEPALAQKQESTKEGVVKLLFTTKKGNYHGYIAPDDGSKDILFHQKYINAEVFERLQRGSRVVAAIQPMKDKVYATRVELI